MFGKYDEKNLIQEVTDIYESKDRDTFIKQWDRMVEDDFHYGDVVGYGIRYDEDNRIDLEAIKSAF